MNLSRQALVGTLLAGSAFFPSATHSAIVELTTAYFGENTIYYTGNYDIGSGGGISTNMYLYYEKASPFESGIRDSPDFDGGYNSDSFEALPYPHDPTPPNPPYEAWVELHYVENGLPFTLESEHTQAW